MKTPTESTSVAYDIDAECRLYDRLAYFALDLDSQPGKLVCNRTITLKDTWAKEAKEGS